MIALVAIYILPSEEGLPPRALVKVADMPVVVSVWDTDQDAWTIEGHPISDELGGAITEHAQSLGVELL